MMKHRVLLVSLVSFLCATAVSCGRAPVPAELAPDTIYVNGKIVTVDKDFSIAEAVAVKGDRILAVGKRADAERLAGAATKTVDLEGATMLPGINDSHAHLAGWGLDQPPAHVDVGFPAVKSIADIVKAVEARRKRISAGEWIEGSGWDEGYLEECKADKNRLPNKADLDAVAPDNPVVLTEYSGHRSWANSKAFALAKITRSTPDPPGGSIARDPKTGEPTGLLYERASGLVRRLIPPPTGKQQYEGIVAGMKAMNALGITSVTDPGVGAASAALYNRVFNDGKATVRMNLLLVLARQREEDVERALQVCGMRTGFGNEWLRVAGYKMFADGIPPLKTAWMYTPYIGGGVGGLVVEGKNDAEKEARLRALIRILHKNRYQIGIHGTGERTVDVVYDEYMKCMEADPWDARHYAIHGDFARPETLKKIGEFNKRNGYELSINVQSAIKSTIADHMIAIVGKERAGYMWPLRAMIDAGIRITDSSDAGVTVPNFLNGIEAAVLRESKATRTPIGPEQAITVKEAIANYTINGAWQTHEEKVKGSIEPGKLADFCVIDKDILTVEPHEIGKAKVLTTIVGGKVVYSAGAAK